MGNIQACCFGDEQPNNENRGQQQQQIQPVDITLQTQQGQQGQQQVNEPPLNWNRLQGWRQCNECRDMQISKLKILPKQITSSLEQRLYEYHNHHNYYHNELRYISMNKFDPTCGDDYGMQSPRAILVNDYILEVTTTWFQLQISQPKYEMQQQHLPDSKEATTQLKLLEYQDQLLNTGQYNCIADIYILRWSMIQVIDLLDNNYKFEDKPMIVKGMYWIQYNCTRICNIWSDQFVYNFSILPPIMILVGYTQLWNKYVNHMAEIQQNYDIIGDAIQLAYYKWIPNKSGQQIPHFRLIGILARIWAQIFITPEISMKLFNCYEQELTNIRENAHNHQSIQILQEFIRSIIDISIDESTVHWLGHSSKFNSTDTLLFQIIKLHQTHTHNYYIKQLEQMSLQEYCNFIDNDAKIMKQIFPNWLYDTLIEKYGIKLKLKKLELVVIKEISNKKGESIMKVITLASDSSGMNIPKPVNYELMDSDSQIPNKFQRTYEQLRTSEKETMVDKQQLMMLFIDKIESQEIKLLDNSTQVYTSLSQLVAQASTSTGSSIQPSGIQTSQYSTFIGDSVTYSERATQLCSYIANDVIDMLVIVNQQDKKNIECTLHRDNQLECRALIIGIPINRVLPQLNFQYQRQMQDDADVMSNQRLKQQLQQLLQDRSEQIMKQIAILQQLKQDKMGQEYNMINVQIELMEQQLNKMYKFIKS